VLWINSLALLIDPPPFTSQYLQKAGLPLVYVRAIILTHVHADHDSGIL